MKGPSGWTPRPGQVNSVPNGDVVIPVSTANQKDLRARTALNYFLLQLENWRKHRVLWEAPNGRGVYVCHPRGLRKALLSPPSEKKDDDKKPT